MKKTVTSYCKRLYDTISAKYGQEKADEICGDGVSPSATSAQRGRWAAEAMGRAEEAFTPDERADALAGCACGPNPTQLAAARKLYLKCGSLEGYARQRNEEIDGAARFEVRDGLLYVSYPRCYCPMIKNSPVPVPKTWCLCSCEYTRRACSAAVGGPVEVTLLGSTAAGDPECLFEVKIL